MRALTLHQPWATLVALGEKIIETRGNGFKYRGELAIHAAKFFDDALLAICRREPFHSVLRAHGYTVAKQLPRGEIVSLHTLLTCVEFTATTVMELLPPYRSIAPFGEPIRFGKHEADFGDFTPGRHGLVLTNRRTLTVPVPARGMQGLWSVPPDIADLVRERAVIRGSE